jgi:transposase InsO family protein
MELNWNIVFAHQWPDPVYKAGVRYLKTGNVSSDVVIVGPSFVKRFEAVPYRLNDRDDIVLTSRHGPWSVNRNNKTVLFETNTDHVFKVVKESDRDTVLNAYIDDPKTVSLNAHTLFDKVFRGGYLGISRRYIHTYLTNNPRALNIRMGKADLTKKPVKSFRPEYPFQHWQMDLIDYSKLYKDNNNFKYILVIIDIFTKFVYLFPLKRKGASQDDEHDTHNDIPVLLNKLFLSGDVPDTLHSDQGTEFRNRSVNDVCVEFGVRQIFGNAYSPQTQGFVENKNKQIKALINSYFIKYGKPTWHHILDRIAYTINNSKHFVTGYTPMQLHRGRDVNKAFTIRPSPDVVSANIEFEFDAELERNYKIKNQELYNRRVNHVSNVLKSEATKRELANDKGQQPDIRTGSIVHVATYVRSKADSKIQGILIKIGDRVIQNPLKYNREKVSRHLADLETRPESVFSKIQLKSRKYYKQLFKVQGIHRIDNVVRYNLVEYDPESTNNHNKGNGARVYIKVSKEAQTLTNVYPEERVWDDKFKRSHLLVLNPIEFNKYTNVPNAPRPNSLSMIDVNIFQSGEETVPNQNHNHPNGGHNNQTENERVMTINDKPVRIVAVQGDGNCMFRAVIKGLELIGRSIPYNNHKRLRQEVVQRNYLQCKTNNAFLTILNASDNRSMESSFSDCDAYKNYMSLLGTWGGHTELLQIQNILQEDNIGLQVYESVTPGNMNLVLDSNNNVTTTPKVRLIRVNQNHYNTLSVSESTNKLCDIQFVVGPKFRKKLSGVRVVYVWLVDNKPKEYSGRIKKYIGAKIQKEGPFAGRRAGSYFEISGVVENNGTRTTHDLELRPELYREKVQDGWWFEDEQTVFSKCKKFLT